MIALPAFKWAHRFRKVNRVPDHPAENRGGRHRYAELAHDQRQVSAAEFEPQIPVHAFNDGVISKPALSKQWVAGFSPPSRHSSIFACEAATEPVIGVHYRRTESAASERTRTRKTFRQECTAVKPWRIAAIATSAADAARHVAKGLASVNAAKAA